MKRSGAAGCAPAGAGPPNPVVALPFLLRRARASFAPRRGAAPAVPFDARAIERNPVATWIGHATFLVRMDTAAFLTDPVWSERASPVSFAGPKRLVPPGVPLDALPRLDFALLSHDHYDDTDLPTVRRLAELGVRGPRPRRARGGRDALRDLRPLGRAPRRAPAPVPRRGPGARPRRPGVPDGGRRNPRLLTNAPQQSR